MPLYPMAFQLSQTTGPLTCLFFSAQIYKTADACPVSRLCLSFTHCQPVSITPFRQIIFLSINGCFLWSTISPFWLCRWTGNNTIFHFQTPRKDSLKHFPLPDVSFHHFPENTSHFWYNLPNHFPDNKYLRSHNASRYASVHRCQNNTCLFLWSSSHSSPLFHSGSDNTSRISWIHHFIHIDPGILCHTAIFSGIVSTVNPYILRQISVFIQIIGNSLGSFPLIFT